MDERERDMLDEGIRLQKIMAQAGVGSRRRCEELITEGRVKVNGVVVRELGTRARPGTDTVEVDGVNIGAGERIVHFAVYKPHGYVSTASDPEGRKKVTDLVPGNLRLYPVGRLDYDSEGLIIVTNDGHLTNVLTHPSHEIGKTYLALVERRPDDLAIATLRHGVDLEDGKTAPARVRFIKPEGDDSWIELTIHEGRNRQVRRMCEAVGHPVIKLIRTRIGGLTLAGLEPGKYRTLSAEEVLKLEAEADPAGLNAELESEDWSLAESRGERETAAPAKPAKVKKAAGAKARSEKPAARKDRPTGRGQQARTGAEPKDGRPRVGVWRAAPAEQDSEFYGERPSRPLRSEGRADRPARPSRGDGPRRMVRVEGAGRPISSRPSKPSSGRPSAGRPSAGRPSAGRPASGRPSTGRPSAGRPSTGRPSAGRPSSGRPSTGRPSSGRPSSGRPSSGRPSTGRPSTGRPATGRPSAGRPSTGRPSTGRPSTGRPSAGRPTGRPSTRGDGPGRPAARAEGPARRTGSGPAKRADRPSGRGAAPRGRGPASAGKRGARKE